MFSSVGSTAFILRLLCTDEFVDPMGLGPDGVRSPSNHCMAGSRRDSFRGTGCDPVAPSQCVGLISARGFLGSSQQAGNN